MSAKGNRGGRRSQELTKLVLATYGELCWLRLPGCTKRATTKDHIIPHSRGGSDALSNLRPACQPCNSKRQNKAHGAAGGVSIKVVTGPPAGGKTTYVQNNADPLDVVIDLDRIAAALTPDLGQLGGEYPDHIRHVAIGARKAAVDRATRLRERVTVWLIHAMPSADQLAEYAQLRWEVITVDPGRATVMQRIYEQRPGTAVAAAERWYASAAAVAAAGAESAADGLTLAPSRDW